MANAIYPLYKQALLTADTNVDLENTAAKVLLVDTGTYTYNTAHDFHADVTGIVATSPSLTTKSVANGVFDCDDITWTAVSGSSAEALILYIDTTVSGTSRLVLFMDTGQTGLPVTPNGGDITYVVDSGANKFFAL